MFNNWDRDVTCLCWDQKNDAINIAMAVLNSARNRTVDSSYPIVPADSPLPGGQGGTHRKFVLDLLPSECAQP